MGDLEPREGRRGALSGGASRGGEGEPSPWNLANALTGARLVLAPVFLWLYVLGERPRALAAFAAAAATDVLDGLVARALNQRTRAGAVLDPLADKLLSACALVALAATGGLPAWLPLLVIGRDVVQLAGAALLRTSGRAVPIAPTRIGKYATSGLAATVLLALAGEYSEASRAAVAPYVAVAGLLAAECVALSFAQYALFFARAIRGPRLSR